MYSFLCTNPNSFIDTKENNSLLYLSTFVCFPLLLSNPESNTDFDDHSSCAASRHLLHQPSMIHTLLPLPLATVNSSRLRILNRPFSMMTTPPTSPKKMHHRRHHYYHRPKTYPKMEPTSDGPSSVQSSKPMLPIHTTLDTLDEISTPCLRDAIH